MFAVHFLFQFLKGIERKLIKMLRHKSLSLKALILVQGRSVAFIHFSSALLFVVGMEERSLSRLVLQPLMFSSQELLDYSVEFFFFFFDYRGTGIEQGLSVHTFISKFSNQKGKHTTGDPTPVTTGLFPPSETPARLSGSPARN